MARVFKTLEKYWTELIGTDDVFSMENRMANSICIITLGLLIIFLPATFMLNNLAILALNLILIVMQLGLYYLSRFKKKHKLAINIYAALSYLALMTNYFINAGIDGTTLILFFITFLTLVAITPRRQHAVWVLLHVLTTIALLMFEYTNPDKIIYSYETRTSRFLDTILTYVISLSFIYLVTINLRNSYLKEKKLAEVQSRAIEAHLLKIENQNKMFREISWIQSHRVRSHVASILGLVEILDFDDPESETNRTVLDGIRLSATELDEVIKEINSKTEIIESQ